MPGRTKTRDEAEESSSSGAAASDAVMEDAPPSAQRPIDDSQEEDGDEDMQDEGAAEEEPEPQRVSILGGSTETAASFQFLKEGHTMGNALRYIIMKNPDVEFCAYSIPHPSEDKMHIRIQTYDTTTATSALAKGLQDLEDLCDVVSEEFWNKREAFVQAEGA